MYILGTEHLQLSIFQIEACQCWELGRNCSLAWRGSYCNTNIQLQNVLEVRFCHLISKRFSLLKFHIKLVFILNAVWSKRCVKYCQSIHSHEGLGRFTSSITGPCWAWGSCGCDRLVIATIVVGTLWMCIENIMYWMHVLVILFFIFIHSMISMLLRLINLD